MIVFDNRREFGRSVASQSRRQDIEAHRQSMPLGRALVPTHPVVVQHSIFATPHRSHPTLALSVNDRRKLQVRAPVNSLTTLSAVQMGGGALEFFKGA